MKNISILGSTGSIGTSVLDVVRQYPGRFRVVGLAAGGNTELLRSQVEAFNPRLVSVADEDGARVLRDSLRGAWKGKLVSGPDGAQQVAAMEEADMVVSAIVGAAGLPPTVAAIAAGKDIALANKETLVMGGSLIMEAAADCGVAMLPVDSEHNAVFQAMAAGRQHDVRRIILTASGGPFREKDKDFLWRATPEQALNHPNWDMGAKISIDSATLMNKGLEVIEAKWLFDVPLDSIEVMIHPQSIVHSMVEFTDGSVIAQMGVADMRIPIAYALTYPERVRLDLPRLDLCAQPLHFLKPDHDRFPALRLACHALRQGGVMPAVLNAANEVAVAAFLARKIRFPEIALAVAETMKRTSNREPTDIAAVLEADLAARVQAESVIEAIRLGTAQKRGEIPPSPELPPGHAPLS